MASLQNRVDKLEGAVVPSRVKVLHVVWSEEDSQVHPGTDKYTVLSPRVMRGTELTQDQLDLFGPDIEIVTLKVVRER